MIVAKYKFNPSTYEDLLPEFNSGFSYTKSDTTNSDGTITRTINSDSLPTYMRFGERVNVSNKSRSLLEILSMNTSNITDMSYMFRYCENLTSVIFDWDTSQATTMSHMFANCSNLLQLDVSKWNLSKVTQMQYIFGMCVSLSSLNVSNWDTSQVTNMEGVFNNCSSLTSLDVSNWNTSKVTTMVSTFRMCSSLISLDLSNWNTSKVTNMSSMFYNCSKLTSLDLSNWNTSKVTNMSSMFYNCSKLTSLDLNNWNTSKVTNMSSMFDTCSSLTSLNISNWNTSRVTNMYCMFQKCSSLISLDLSNWNTSKVTNMAYFVNWCTKLTTLDISNWDTSNITNMVSITYACDSLYKINLKYANQSTVSKIHENLNNRTNTTKGYVLSSVDFTSNKNWQRIKSSHNNFYLPQPLNKIGDVKDRLYWDENKGHYCIEQRFAREKANDLDWMIVDQDDDFICFKGNPLLNTYKQSDKGLCNKLTCYEQYLLLTIPKEGIALSGNAMHIVLPKTRGILSTEQLEVFVNDLFVIWELETPNIIDLPHLNKKFTFDSYNPSTTIDIPNRPLKASKTYLDAPIARYRYTNLQPSTQYNVQFDCKGDAAIKVNLGGTEVTFTPTSDWTRKNLTITTPSELVNDKLSISNVGITSNNKIDNVMLFSEVIAQEPYYIDTIQSIGELQDNGTYKINITTYEGVLPLTNISYDYLVNAKTFFLNDWTCVILPFKTSGTFTMQKKSRDGSMDFNFCIFNTVSNTSPVRQNSWDILKKNGTFTWESDGNWIGVGFYTDYKNELLTKTEFSILCENKGIPRYPQPIENQSTHSIYLPQPLRKKGNAKDKFYWDDDKGHYCIEQNVSDNLEVLSSPNIIDLTEMNQKFSFDTYLPNTSIDVTNLPLQPYGLLLEDDTVRYKSTIEPSTLYTIQFNCIAKSTTNLTLDLGGTRVTVEPIIGVNHVQITTPSELTSDRLFLIGTGIIVKEVIVNKGDMNQYPKYFDGEQSVGELQTDGTYKIVIKTNEGFTVTIRTSSPLTKLDKIYWNNIEKRYEIDRNGVIEVPTVEGDIINLPRLYQKVDTTINISTDNIEPSKIDISYKDIN